MTVSKEQLTEQARKKIKALKMSVTQSAFKDIRQELELDLALAEIALAGMEADQVRNPVLAYADSYRDMAKQGVESIPVWSVITDLERNIAPHFTAPQPLTTSERAELENYRNAQKPVMFIDGDISPADAEKLAAAIREINSTPSESVIIAETAQPAPVVLKDHQIRELVNELRDIAVEYHGTQQLRERIARTVRAAIKGADHG